MLDADVPEHLATLECPVYEPTAAVAGTALDARRVALISSAGLMHQGDPPFGFGAADYRVIDADSPVPVLMTHVSTNFDRTGFAQDANVVLPLDRLRELVADGVIGSVARFHYSFMGATAPDLFEEPVTRVAGQLAADEVDLALLIPV